MSDSPSGMRTKYEQFSFPVERVAGNLVRVPELPSSAADVTLKARVPERRSEFPVCRAIEISPFAKERQFNDQIFRPQSGPLTSGPDSLSRVFRQPVEHASCPWSGDSFQRCGLDSWVRAD
jgi:hypothetical protein